MTWSDPITADLIIGFFIGCAFAALMMWGKA
jgi:hypothetical protein